MSVQLVKKVIKIIMGKKEPKQFDMLSSTPLIKNPETFSFAF